MPIGVFANCFAVFFGGVAGSMLGKKLSGEIQEKLPMLFGFCSIGVGVNSIIKVNNMAPVVMAMLTGYILGQSLHLEQKATRFFRWLVTTLRLGGKNIDMDFYITAVAIFCCSGFGWFGTLTEAIAGDSSVLYSKAVLDLFTAVVFAAALGKALCAIPLPQVVILLGVFGCGKLLAPWVNATMMADLTACGGIITMATGFRVAKIKSFPLIDLMPALILVMPFSAIWTALMG